MNDKDTPSLTNGTAQADRVYRRLRRAITTCELVPDERVKVMEISAAEGVSPGAVREALSRLMTEHLVVTLHQRGFRVSHLHREDMNDLYATRADLESELVARSVAMRDSDWLSRLRHAYSVLQEQGLRPATDEAAALAHEAFHRALVAGCGSPWSLRLFDTIYAASERYRFFAYRNLTGARNPRNEHEAIFEAAVGGNAERARTLAFEHTMLTRDLLNTALQLQPVLAGSSQQKSPIADEDNDIGELPPRRLSR